MTFSILLPRKNIPKDKTMTKPLCNFKDKLYIQKNVGQELKHLWRCMIDKKETIISFLAAFNYKNYHYSWKSSYSNGGIDILFPHTLTNFFYI